MASRLRQGFGGKAPISKQISWHAPCIALGMTQTLITAVPDFKAFARASEEEATALAANSNSEFFGKDGLTFGDVLDALNPLNHIPIVSDIYSNLTGEKASAGSRLAGGALFGGPIGLAVSIASLMFEEGTGGKSPVEAMYAALTDSDAPTTQLAHAETAAPTAQASNAADAQTLAAAAPIEPVQLASLSPAAPSSRIPIADTAKHAVAEIPDQAAKTVLDLYGASAASAHGSYQKAQMLPYLRDVTVSKTL